MKFGDKVTYLPTGEKGVIKKISENENKVWVVFQCNEEWDNFYNYTGQLVYKKDIKIGWN